MPQGNYIKVSIQATEPEQQILIAFLSGMGYYAFEEKTKNLDAFILEADYSSKDLQVTLDSLFPDAALAPQTESIAPKDWNREWEEGFQPVIVGNFCAVRPPFKPAPENVTYDLLIQPKMSFGTGHHNTTRMMVELSEGLDFNEKKVLDMGCGTGVLGILSSKMGADEVIGIDIDEWCYINSNENIELNKVENMHIIQGGAESIPETLFDVIYANINRNILLRDGQHYTARLAPEGKILLSGFFDFDEPKIIDYFYELNCKPEKRLERDGWMALQLIRC